MWEQIPTREMQQELQTMFSDSCLQDRSILSGIQPFLEAPTNTPGEQAAAKRLLCAHFGLVTQKGDAQSQARLQEAMQFQLDIEVSLVTTGCTHFPTKEPTLQTPPSLYFLSLFSVIIGSLQRPTRKIRRIPPPRLPGLA